ncbi:ehsyntaxin J, putative [Entamoeba histolytica KU27]|uniref:Ehsyntaxin J, putative n=1 Tax=Entamoeba histolytica KU27 TaxID=885311 RepID=M2S3E5_ENTHI|nr:ehsyntaxin J, putative [Entamoeba histolytica KU27]
MSNQTAEIAIDILQNMRKANDSLRQASVKIQSMEDKLDISDASLQRAMCRKKVNIIFYTVLIVGFLVLCVYATCKFYFKVVQP